MSQACRVRTSQTPLTILSISFSVTTVRSPIGPTRRRAPRRGSFLRRRYGSRRLILRTRPISATSSRPALESVRRTGQAGGIKPWRGVGVSPPPRKAVAHSLYWLVVALLVGAFSASCAAIVGGRRRDLGWA